MKEFSVTFAIGATSESSVLKETVEYIINTCEEQDLEKIIIVKTKNPSKACSKTIDELEKKYANLVIGYEQKRPYIGGAIQDGFDLAQSSHILLFPGDLAVDFSTIPVMIEKEKINPNGIIKVSRWLKKNSFQNYSVIRKFFNGLAQSFLRTLYHTKLTDMTIPVQIMPTELYRKIDWKELGFPFLLEMVLCPLRLGVDIEEIPTQCYDRTEGYSSNSIIQTVSYLRPAFRIRFTKPEKLLKSKERSA